MRAVALTAALATLLGNIAVARSETAKDLEEHASDTAEERNSEPGVDPWLAGASLVSRPTLGEAFKVANTTNSEGDATYSASFGASWFQPDSVVLEGLQLSGAYEPATKTGTLGLKWNLSLGDVRFMSDDRVRAIAAKAEAASAPCRARVQEVLDRSPPGEMTPEELKLVGMCHDDESPVLDAELERFRVWRPTFSLAISSAYDGENRQRGKTTATVAAELKGKLGSVAAAVTLNGEAGESPADMATMATDRERHAGGGLAVTLPKFYWTLSFQLEGKLLACLSDTCADGDSSTHGGASLSVELDDDIAFGVTVTAKGDGARLSDAVGALELSYSFDRPD